MADLSCHASYRQDSSVIGLQGRQIKCNAKGKWEPEPIQCIPGPIIINIYANEAIINFGRVTVNGHATNNNKPPIDIRMGKANQ